MYTPETLDEQVTHSSGVLLPIRLLYSDFLWYIWRNNRVTNQCLARNIWNFMQNFW